MARKLSDFTVERVIKRSVGMPFEARRRLLMKIPLSAATPDQRKKLFSILAPAPGQKIPLGKHRRISGYFLSVSDANLSD